MREIIEALGYKPEVQRILIELDTRHTVLDPGDIKLGGVISDTPHLLPGLRIAGLNSFTQVPGAVT
jgi:hypothetical protein